VSLKSRIAKLFSALPSNRVTELEKRVDRLERELQENPVRQGQMLIHKGKKYRIEVMPHIRWRTPEGKEVLAVVIKEE
jgi:hypothetical protein